jgi:hypothetical protein
LGRAGFCNACGTNFFGELKIRVIAILMHFALNESPQDLHFDLEIYIDSKRFLRISKCNEEID